MEILKGKTSEEVSSKASSYANFFTRDKSSSVMVEQRKDSAKEMTSTYYDLVTDFYQYGWGDSFHFCPVYQGRSFQQCLVDHEYCLSQKLNLKQGTKVLVRTSSTLHVYHFYNGATILCFYFRDSVIYWVPQMFRNAVYFRDYN